MRDATAELAYKKEEAERASTAKSRFRPRPATTCASPLHALSLFAADLQRQVNRATSPTCPGFPSRSRPPPASRRTARFALDVSRLDVAGIKTDIRPFPCKPSRPPGRLYRRPAQAKQLMRSPPTNTYFPTSPWSSGLANLISNAVRYTPRGCVSSWPAARGPCAHRGARQRHRHRAEHQAAIFAEFYPGRGTWRGNRTRVLARLSIVDRLAFALGAPIYLRSQPGVGTTFGVALPACQPSPRRRPRQSASLRPHFYSWAAAQPRYGRRNGAKLGMANPPPGQRLVSTRGPGPDQRRGRRPGSGEPNYRTAPRSCRLIVLTEGQGNRS